MTANRIMVAGATSPLGGALLQKLTPDRALAVIGPDEPAPPGFEHVRVGDGGYIAAESFANCEAVINVAHSVDDDTAELETTNILFPETIAYAARKAGVARMVHLSSFAIFGNARHIDTSTPDAPITPYGRSKAEGERRVLGAATDDFRVEAVRMPFMFSSENPGSLRQLVTMAAMLRRLPQAKSAPLRRSMITYDSAARFLLERSGMLGGGWCCAADAHPFDYILFAKIVSEEAGTTIRPLSMPFFFTASVEALLPSLGRRLLRSNLLAPAMNAMEGQASEIESELRKMIKTRYER